MSDFVDRFREWLAEGIEAGFCGPIVCAAHDGIPTTSAEDEAIWESEEDICLPVMRAYDSVATRKAVEANHGPTSWR
jgi:hypothetical protein